jgi:type 1 glutamine amidotransferase
MPALAKILAKHHGFKCTVLFTIDPEDGTINPNVDNIPGLEALKTADLMVIFTRLRDLPGEQMKHIADYVESGKPVIGLRTATHAFKIPRGKAHAHWSDDHQDGGFGRRVLGEKWVDHHGHHGKEGCRGILVKERRAHPILRGINDGDIFALSDVYTVRLPLPGDCTPLVLGQVTQSLDPASPPVAGKKNDPMMPVAWTKTYKGGRVFTSTMGASQDLQSEGLRRLLVNACYWALGEDGRIPARAKVDFVGEYRPSPFKFDGFKKGVRPADLAIK